MTTVQQPPVFPVKRSRQTLPTRGKWRRKSTGLCKCGGVRHNPNDAYCRECRNSASREHRKKLATELKRLKALEEQQLSKGNDNGETHGRT